MVRCKPMSSRNFVIVSVSRLRRVPQCMVCVFALLVSCSSDILAQESGTDPLPVLPSAEEYSLTAVRDNFRLRPEENKAYYGLLHHAHEVNSQALAAAAEEFVESRKSQTKFPLFKDMLDHPEDYRGQPVKMSGHVLQIITYEALENPWGIRQVYEASLFEEDAQGNLTTVVFTELPPGVEVGDKLLDGVTATGYFLKLYHYDAEDKHTHKAPILLARTLNVAPPKVPAGGMPLWLMVPVIAGLALLVLAIVLVQMRDQRLTRQRQRDEVPDRIEGVQL